MGRVIKTNRHFLTAVLLAAIVSSLGISTYGKQKIKVIKEKHKKHKQTQSQKIEAAAEPDKILYERALNSLKHSKYTEARLELQTLINTYPDSEYLAKAKLAIADSFYKEGGVADLLQAIDAYKSFIVFFPFLDEAQYAQMQVAMCHYRMMLKSDRDPSEAESAEAEFQNFILKYPQSPLIPRAQQDLRNVQEVIADGEFKIARFYYLKPDYQAAAARLMEVAERYPLYSHSDDAVWMLGDIYMVARKYTKNEDMKNKFSDYAAKCYDRILRDYPLSEHAAGARAQLKSMGLPIPAADPHALARMGQDQRYQKKHHEFVLLKWPKDMLESRPDVSDAARVGQPNLTPPNDIISATNVLKPNGPGPVFTAAAAPAVASNADTSSGEAVPVSAAPQSQVEDAPTTSVGVQILSAPASSNAAGATSTAPSSPAPAGESTPASSGPSVLSAVGSDTGNSTVSNSAAPSPPASASDPTPATPAASAARASASPTVASRAGSPAKAKPAERRKASKVNPKTESTSQKKHGFHKLIPW